MCLRTPAALVCALLLSAVAAPAASGQDNIPVERRGIAKAKAAGIEIDSKAVEGAMARAPVGSCPNDPTQPKCPKAEAMAEGEGSVWGPDVTAARTAQAGKGKAWARAAQWPWYCQLYWNSDNPYKAAGWAQMNASTTCTSAIEYHELYGSLHKRYNGEWYQMSYHALGAPGGVTIRVRAYYDCTASVSRYWRANADAWALYAGAWHYKGRDGFNWLACG